jgi:AAA domain-containing protein
MNTPAAPRRSLRIKAEHIGPIMLLDQSLSDDKQNLIFARNGTGKSFIARALRMLDETAITEIDPAEVPNLLVSEEAPKGLGDFSLWEGSDCIGGLALDVKSKTVSRTPAAYIFHVFSEDYVDENLRNKLETLNGEISHEIIVGKDNAELDDKETKLASKDIEQSTKKGAINAKFQEGKRKLQADFAIRASLGSFQNLKPDIYFEDAPFSASAGGKSLKELLGQYNTFKSIPSDPELPQGVNIQPLTLDITAIENALARITSPSTVAEVYKERIRRDQSFFQTGPALYETDKSECTFCTQSMSDIAIKAVSAYSDYFNDAEAKERTSVKRMITDTEQAERAIEKWEKDCLRAKSHFDDLKGYFPSFKEKAVAEISALNEELAQYLQKLREALTKKTGQPCCGHRRTGRKYVRHGFPNSKSL